MRHTYKRLAASDRAELEKILAPCELTRPERTLLFRYLDHDVDRGARLREVEAERPSTAARKRDARAREALRKAVENTTDDTLRDVSRNLTRQLEREARAMLRGPQPERSRLCRRCVTALWISPAALRSAFVEELSREELPGRKPEHARSDFLRRIGETLRSPLAWGPDGTPTRAGVLDRLDDSHLAGLLALCLRRAGFAAIGWRERHGAARKLLAIVRDNPGARFRAQHLAASTPQVR